MSIVFPIALGSIIVIATIVLYLAYQGFFSSFVMFVLTLISLAISWNYCEPLGWSLGKWHQSHLFFILLFGGLITLGGLAKSIMLTNRYIKLAVGAGSVAFLIIVASRAEMPPEAATGNSSGQALAFVGLFAITLLSLRAIADNVISGNMTFPWQIERLGGATLGFFTGMIIVGVVLLGWQMLPFGPGLLAGGYQDFFGMTPTIEHKPAETPDARWRRMARYMQISHEVSAPAENSWASYNRYDEKLELAAAPFPYADGFTLWLVKGLSKGSCGSEPGRRFHRVHPDLLLELWGNRNGINSLSYQAAPGNAILSAQWKLSQENSPKPNSDTVRGILSLTLNYDACDGKDEPLRFKGTQVRLVGASGKSYWPVAIHLDGIPWSELYGGDLGKLTSAGQAGTAGNYLQWPGQEEGNYLWARDAQGEGQIDTRREIRIYCQQGKQEGLWFQVQLLGESGDFQMLPSSLAVIRSLSKNEKPKLELIFEIDRVFEIGGREREENPDYVVFKRTAMKAVKVISSEAKTPPAPEPPEKTSSTQGLVPSTGQVISRATIDG